jgi:hypothetical protein
MELGIDWLTVTQSCLFSVRDDSGGGIRMIVPAPPSDETRRLFSTIAGDEDRATTGTFATAPSSRVDAKWFASEMGACRIRLIGLLAELLTHLSVSPPLSLIIRENQAYMGQWATRHHPAWGSANRHQAWTTSPPNHLLFLIVGQLLLEPSHNHMPKPKKNFGSVRMTCLFWIRQLSEL